MDTLNATTPLSAEARKLGWGPENHTPELMLYLSKKSFQNELLSLSNKLLKNEPLTIDTDHDAPKTVSQDSLQGYLYLQGKISQVTTSTDASSNIAQKYLEKQNQVLSSIGG